jgi:hypothetical protein
VCLAAVPAACAAGGYRSQVRVGVHLWAAAAGRAELSVSGAWGQRHTTSLSFPAGDSNITVVLRAPKKDIELWWPIGAGAQPLYHHLHVISMMATEIILEDWLRFTYIFESWYP